MLTPFSSGMFIDGNITTCSRRSKERNVSRGLPVYLSSAPSNGAGGFFSSIYKHVTPNGVKQDFTDPHGDTNTTGNDESEDGFAYRVMWEEWERLNQQDFTDPDGDINTTRNDESEELPF